MCVCVCVCVCVRGMGWFINFIIYTTFLQAQNGYQKGEWEFPSSKVYTLFIHIASYHDRGIAEGFTIISKEYGVCVYYAT